MRIIAFLLLILWAGIAQAETPKDVMTAYYNRYVEAIWLAEGGERAKPYYYGIRSVKCKDKADCRAVCFSTVRNNYRRWLEANTTQTFLEFLANKYAPIGADNDPKGLNHNWIKNVAFYLKKGGG